MRFPGRFGCLAADLPTCAGDGEDRHVECVRCRGEELVEHAGVLDEAVCPRCGGRFVDAAAAERVLVETLGLDRALLADLASSFPGGASCPGCRRRMRLPPVKGVPVDLCVGCGGVWFDAGELHRLSGGRFVELAASGPPVSVGAVASSTPPLPTTPAVAGTGARGWAVFVRERGPAADAVVAAFAASGFRTAVDARLAAARATGGVVADEISDVDAHRLAAALVARGVAAAAVPPEQLGLPAPVRVREIVIDGADLVVPDGLGRPRRSPIAAVRALAAAQARHVVQRPAGSAGGIEGTTATLRVMSRAVGAILPGGDVLLQAAAQRAEGKGTTTALKEVRETFLDVILPEVRLRFDASGLIVRSGTGGPTSLADVAALLESVVDGAVPRHRGFAALLARGEPPELRAVRELDREEAWVLWRAGAT